MDFYVGYCYYIHMNVRKIRRTGAALFIAIFLLSTGSCGLLELFGFQGPAAPELVITRTSGIQYGRVITEGTPVEIDISNSFDPNNDPFGVSWSLSPPVGASVSFESGFDQGTLVRFTPPVGFPGTYTITTTLSDGRRESSNSFSLSTTPPPNVESAWLLNGDYSDIAGPRTLTGIWNNGANDRFDVAGSTLLLPLGSGDYTEAANINALQMKSGTTSGSFTLGAWLSISDLDPGGDFYVISYAGNAAWSLGFVSGKFGLFSGGSLKVDFPDYSNISIDVWNHFAITYDSSSNTMRLYFNGVEVDSNTNASPVHPSTLPGDLEVGTGALGNGMQGSLDDVIIINRALNNIEIALLAADRL
jgi:hypothetical protein